MHAKQRMYLWMTLLVCLWGLDYSVSKQVLRVFHPLTLMFLKYTGGLYCPAGLKLCFDRKFVFHKRDILLFAGCAVVGQGLYYYCEYTAMDYIPVSMITIVLAFVPVVSILIERIFLGRRSSGRMAVGILVSIIGIILVLGADMKSLLHGSAWGYLLALGAVLCWNGYNFLTARAAGRGYSDLSLSFNQLLCTVVLFAPYAIWSMPPASDFTPAITGSLIYLGLGSAGLGYLILVAGIHQLGPTPSALFANMMPVPTAVFAWIFLGESLSWLQILGGVIVIVSTCFVIREKERLAATSRVQGRHEADG